MSSALSGFWSYVHADDEAEGDRITLLARKLVAEYEMITGEKVELFLDKDGVEWGEKWRDKIAATLASVAFFIPVLTPRYFLSPNCRDELESWIRRTNQRGLRGLLLPLYYITVPSVDEKDTKDYLVQKIREYQWADWRCLRLEEVDSAAYRQAVANLAERLATANKHAEEIAVQGTQGEMEAAADEESDETLGTIDRMAKVEQESPEWMKTIVHLTDQISIIGREVELATAELNRREAQDRFSYRISILRRLARALDEPADQIERLANQFVSQLHDVDDGLRAIIGEVAPQVAQEPKLREDVCRFFEQIQGLSGAATGGLSSVQQWVKVMQPVERMSRDLRPRLRRLRHALTILFEARKVTDSWMELIAASGVDCQEFDRGVEW